MGTYNITDFGASADGKTINTKAIQLAIDACHKAGGGTVLCTGGSFRTGTLTLKSNVHLHLEEGCKILGSESLDDYEDLEAPGFMGENAPEKSRNCLIKAVDAENITVTGTGEINGSGLAFYDHGKTDSSGKLDKPETPRPRMIMFYKCRNVLFEDTSYIDSPCWTFWLMKCEDVAIHRIKIRGNRIMRNVDGIDIDACRNVTVSDCIMDTEDDCVALRSIQNMYDTPAVCENVTVTNCVLESSSQGVRIGCPSDGLIQNCTFSNLVINSSYGGIIIQNPRGYLAEGSSGGAEIHDIVFSNITINCRRIPIWIFIEDGIRLKRLSDLSFSNFRIKGGSPCIVQGSRETAIRKISFSDMDIETSGEDAVICRKCERIKFNNVELSNKPEL
ncbi:MAG: hypothetical protein JW957_05550 [Candidatus Omnitrophica bacterium]|nr:hypothetical protein [Candidatus Omnitrophota bacterium]